MNAPSCSRIGLLALLLAGAAAAQSPAARPAIEGFERAFRSGSAKERQDAIDVLARTADPAAVPPLLDALRRTARALEDQRERYAKTGEKIQDELGRRVDKRARDNRVASGAVEVAEKKVAPLREELKALSDQIDEGEAAEAALRKGLGTLVDGMEPGRQAEAALAIGSVLEKAAKPSEKAVIVRALGWSKAEPSRALVRETLARADQPALRVAALDALGQAPTEADEEAGVAALADESWQVQAAALPILEQVGGARAVGALIAILERLDGRLVTGVIRALRLLTKRDFADNAALWREWWTKNEGAFAGRGPSAGVPGDPEAGAEAPGAVKAGGKGSYFYGIETRSKRIIYVLDVSNSMNWPPEARWSPGQPMPSNAGIGHRRIDRLVKELLDSIAGLPEDATFNIVFFDSEVSVWKKKMTVATKAAKAEARKWAEAVEAGGNTNIFDALEKAFGIAGRGTFDKGYRPEADTVFVLSDGYPNRGRITEPAQILREVRDLNALQKLEIHCVGVGAGEDEPYIKFLKSLAEQNGGQFVLRN